MGLQVKKSSGDNVDYNVEKLRRSLKLSGAGDLLVEKIIERIEGKKYDGISTKEIYKQAFSMLKSSSRSSAARYKLKNAIMELGPTGYPFERFVAEILKFQGFETEVGVIVQGHCVKHEVDVIAHKDDHHYMVECKFRNDRNKNCDVKIPLYIRSRFLDIEKEWNKNPKMSTKIHQGWIFTNTRFSDDAIQYGNCEGLILVGWDYPKNGSLKERIDLSGLHPVTCLTTLTISEKQKILEMGKVLSKEVLKEKNILVAVGVKSASRREKILSEINELCKL